MDQPGPGPRRTTTSEQLRVWRDFVETTEALRSRLSSRLQAESSLSSSDYAVLLALHDADGHCLRSSTLADAVGWERSRLSHQVGRMERRGLVARKGGRSAGVALTDDGAATFRRASVAHLRAVRQLFVDALTDDQLAAAGEIAAALRSALDRPES
ncbi:MarR family winged helix-turn-helix transcriptional regulator [Isoptericola cucumis]|uniref:MarR family transcriptional regulator n=1 Tax=Isoptericola cucumis TaxID=1776856 RepID=A0ABQ2B2I2_9MICO|nr:MarR family transcriptional regulator [Isoptericola cucumis]GGI06169.1 MarR family transcriptional regulator [Isoptericola cucumis]